MLSGVLISFAQKFLRNDGNTLKMSDLIEYLLCLSIGFMICIAFIQVSFQTINYFEVKGIDEKLEKILDEIAISLNDIITEGSEIKNTSMETVCVIEMSINLSKKIFGSVYLIHVKYINKKFMLIIRLEGRRCLSKIYTPPKNIANIRGFFKSDASSHVIRYFISPADIREVAISSF